MFGNNTYDKDISVFERIEASQADKLLTSEDLAVVYIGRGTCPYCRKFAKKLNTVSNELNTTIYYVDSDDFYDGGIEDFREKHNIRTVPGFLVKKTDKISVVCDSSLPEEKIITMVK